MNIRKLSLEYIKASGTHVRMFAVYGSQFYDEQFVQWLADKLMYAREYKVGDRVIVNGYQGTVEEVLNTDYLIAFDEGSKHIIAKDEFYA